MATSNNKKSLNEQIEDIMNSPISDRAKRIELVKLGLQPFEVNLMWGMARQPNFDFSRLTFGVEIECFNFERYSLMNEANAFGLQVKSEGYNHTDNQHYYKIVNDASITGSNPQEVVSPILQGSNGLDGLQKLCFALARCDAKVNKSCGLHVHIGAANISDAHYCRIVKNYQRIENAIDTFMPASRRANNNIYCRSLANINFSWCTTKREIAGAMAFERYYKVNACAYSRHKTIEFRQHSGTTDFEKISNWVKFLAKLVEYSHQHECIATDRIEDIPFLTDEEKTYFISRRNALN